MWCCFDFGLGAENGDGARCARCVRILRSPDAQQEDERVVGRNWPAAAPPLIDEQSRQPRSRALRHIRTDLLARRSGDTASRPGLPEAPAADEAEQEFCRW